MVNPNTINKLPTKARLYVSVKILILLILISLIFAFFGLKTWFIALVVLLVFLGLPFLIYFWIYYSILTFVVGDDKITINFGIVIKHSKSIPFGNIQNIDNVRGILSRMFGISKVNIWTASPSQIQVRNKETVHKPDMRLELNLSDGEWLKNFILDKRSKKQLTKI